MKESKARVVKRISYRKPFGDEEMKVGVQRLVLVFPVEKVSEDISAKVENDVDDKVSTEVDG